MAKIMAIKKFNYDVAEVREIKPKKPEPKTRTVKLEGVEFIKGNKGDSPTDEHLLSLIKPLIIIPDPIAGEPGKTPTSEELLALIRPLIPKLKNGETPSDEKILSLIATLLPPVKDFELDTPQEVRDKLESLKKGSKLSINAIEDLAKIIEDLYKKIKEITVANNVKSTASIYAGVPDQVRFVDDEIPSEVPNGVVVAFTLAHIPATGSLHVYVGGIRLKSSEWTLVGKIVTLNIAPQTGEVVLFDYRRK